MCNFNPYLLFLCWYCSPAVTSALSYQNAKNAECVNGLSVWRSNSEAPMEYGSTEKRSVSVCPRIFRQMGARCESVAVCVCWCAHGATVRATLRSLASPFIRTIRPFRVRDVSAAPPPPRGCRSAVWSRPQGRRWKRLLLAASRRAVRSPESSLCVASVSLSRVVALSLSEGPIDEQPNRSTPWSPRAAGEACDALPLLGRRSVKKARNRRRLAVSVASTPHRVDV